MKPSYWDIGDEIERLVKLGRSGSDIWTDIESMVREYLGVPRPTGEDPTQKLFVIQDTRSYCGDDLLLWKPKGKGYTTNFDEAGRFTEEEARGIERNRGTDKAIPLEVAQRALRRVVDSEKLSKESSTRASLES